ncbi:MAG TPA: gamma-butyrobetaine hydroxylase-like domain-containing protein [Candidatus Limnocylindrales bacterium]|nr:gamma-butyrobetaine hydroxylase-like domain-containing protein [Candidatus Limnocylindrales bacterium]
MLSVEPVGNYAIRINWSDGHNSGIYSSEHFREDAIGTLMNADQRG